MASMAAASVTGVISSPSNGSSGYQYDLPIGPVQGGGILPSSVSSGISQASAAQSSGYQYEAPIGPVQGGGILPSSSYSGVPQAALLQSVSAYQQLSIIPSLQNRADYVRATELGDTRTQQLIASGLSPMQALNKQIQEAYLTPGIRDDQYYTNELAKATQSLIATSSQYHYAAKETGIAQAVNPYEYTGDLALGLLKGYGEQKTTPVDLSVLGLPGGRGIQEVQWVNAKGGNLQPNWSLPIAVIDTAKSLGTMGPYGELGSYSSTLGPLSLEQQQAISFAAGKTAGWDVRPETITKSDIAALGYGIGSTTPAGRAGLTEVTMPARFASSTYDVTQKTTTPSAEEMRAYELSVYGGYSGGILGYAAFGEKAPKVIAGAAGSIADVFASGFGFIPFTPFAETMRKTDTGYSEYMSRLSGSEKAVTGLEKQGVSTYGLSSEGKIQIDTSNPQALAFQKQYETAQKDYSSTISSGVEKGYLKSGGGGLTTSPEEFTYQYGEYSKWGAGAGKTLQETFGISKGALEQYGTVLENLKGPQFTTTRLGYGATYTALTRPEKIVTAAGAGIALGGVGEVVGGIAEIPSISSRGAALATQFPTAAKISPSIIPAIFTGAGTYSVTEGFTASPQRTEINIGKAIPELAAIGGGATVGYGAARGVIESGYVGFGTREIPVRPGSVSIETAVKRAGIDITDLGIETSPSSAATLSSVKDYGIRTQGYPAKTLRQIEIEKGRIATPFEEFVAQPLVVEPVIQASATGRGLPTFKEQVTIAEFKRLGDIGVDISSQPRTVGMRLLEPELPRVSGVMPMDILPGVGSKTLGVGELKAAATPNPFADLAERMGVRAEPVASPKGLESRFGGAPISEQMLQSVVNENIRAATGTTGFKDVDVTIQKISIESRMRPVVGMAVSQQVLPSATEATFKTKEPLSNIPLEEILGIFEERRVPSRGLPSGMQMDYLREALGKRTEPVIRYTSYAEQGIPKSSTNLKGVAANIDESVGRTLYTKPGESVGTSRNQPLDSLVSPSLRTGAGSTAMGRVKGVTQIESLEKGAVVAAPQSVRTITSPTLRPKEIKEISDTTTRIVPIITPVISPTEIITPTPRKTTLFTPPIIPPFKFPYSGTAGGGGGGKRMRPFTETFLFGLDISTRQGMRYGAPKGSMPTIEGLPGVAKNLMRYGRK